MFTRRPARLFVVATLAASLALSTVAAAVDAAGPHRETERQTLLRYARSTWASFVAMTNPSTGLPADKLNADGTTSPETSDTNIGAYMWSTVVAERLGIISHRQAVTRLARTLTSLETMERHWPDGQYYNWYDHNTLAVIRNGPGPTQAPILSSVDNGWLAAALQVVATSEHDVSARARAIFESMDFGVYHREPTGYKGQRVDRIAFHIQPETGDSPCCYDTIVSESRIATYIGITKGELPPSTYFGQWRTFPDTCDWSWQETKPIGVDRTYEVQGADNGRITVFEGAYPYNGTRVVPGWGGSMFEALMPTLFVPEEKWAPHSWRINHPLTVAAQIHHGLAEAQYGYWGFSPSNTPEGGYNVYGVDAIGLNPDGYPSNEDNTFVDHGFPGCPGAHEAKPDPAPEAYTNGVVTPHAAFLALRWAPKAVLADLANLEHDFAIYGKWGFRDSVNVDTGTVSNSYLSLDQGIIMGAIGNALGHDVLRHAFATQEVKQALKPLLGMERFGADPGRRVQLH